MPFILIYDAWHEWFYERWRRGDGMFPGGSAIERAVLYGEYNGFGGEW